jgi:hypothetical protein
MDSHREQKWISLPAAAARLRMSWSQAYNAVLRGTLQGTRHSGRWFVTTSSVARLLSRRSNVDVRLDTSERT